MTARQLAIVKDALPFLLKAFVNVTLPLTALSFLLALLISVLVAMIQYAKVPVLKELCRVYIWIIRGTPLMVQLYLVFYGLPDVGIVLDPFPTGVLVFGLNEGAYMAEAMRGALESVPSGQLEAGYCVNMSYTSTMWHVILPQALRTVFPSFANSLISMVKGTSIVSAITVVDMFKEALDIIGRHYEVLPLYIEVALIYLVFCSLLTLLQRLGEKLLGAYGGAR